MKLNPDLWLGAFVAYTVCAVLRLAKPPYDHEWVTYAGMALSCLAVSIFASRKHRDIP